MYSILRPCRNNLYMVDGEVGAHAAMLSTSRSPALIHHWACQQVGTTPKTRRFYPWSFL